jgi:hypothetical protein
MNRATFLKGFCVGGMASWSAVAVTPLWNRHTGCQIGAFQNGVALRLPPHSKTWRQFERFIGKNKTT